NCLARIARVGTKGRRRTAVEIAVAGECLPDERRANDLAVALDKAAIGLARKDDLGNAGHGQRVGETGDDRQGDDQDDRWANLSPHGRSPQTRCRAPTTRSMALMPMNGMTAPPRR